MGDFFEEDLSYPPPPSWVRPGISFHRYFNEGNPNNAKFHVRALVDNRVVVRTWWKNKQRWNYEVWHSWEFEFDGIFPPKKR